MDDDDDILAPMRLRIDHLTRKLQRIRRISDFYDNWLLPIVGPTLPAQRIAFSALKMLVGALAAGAIWLESQLAQMLHDIEFTSRLYQRRKTPH